MYGHAATASFAQARAVTTNLTMIAIECCKVTTKGERTVLKLYTWKVSLVEQPCAVALLAQILVRLSHGAVRPFEIPQAPCRRYSTRASIPAPLVRDRQNKLTAFVSM
jgi:hypothetical protein